MTTKNNIPAGYKDSAVGIIPQEWEVFDFRDIASVSKDKYLPSTSSQIPCIELEHLSQNDGALLGYTEAKFQKSSKNIFKTGDVIFGKLRPYLRKYWLATFDGVCSSEIWVLNSKEEVCSNEYLYRLVSSDRFIQFANVSIGSKMPRADWDFVSITPFPVPPMAEQRKIAEILDVWDEAIEKQSRLIEKLELRKRALMQRLLTGRTRLPGFTTPWQKVSYSEILKEVKRNMTWDDNEEYDLISVKRRSEGLFHRDRLLGKDIKTKNLRPAKFGDFLISKMQIVHGASGLVTEEFDGMKISGSYIALVAKSREKVDMNFINWYSQTPYFYHQTYVSSYGVHIEKMTFDLESFMSMNIMLPPLPEQKAIAEVLTAADNEIATHRKKLDALRLQKRGLMQQLLIGKTRVKI